MSQKRSHIDLDPDYEDVSDQQNKRQRVLEEGAKEATKSKIETIITKQFGQEIENKKEEIINISETLEKSRTILDRLRACIVASYYGNASQQKCPQSKSSQQAPLIHPTVKKYLGKAPKGTSVEKSTSQQSSASLQITCQSSKANVTTEQGTEKIGSMSLKDLPGMTVPNISVPTTESVTMATSVDREESETRAGRYKIKKRIIVGNISKTIPADRRDENDQATHKWMVYVRGPKDSPRIDHFIKKVWFFLHPSYRPNDLVEVSEHPFHLTRRGWGEFPVRVQLHFKDSRNKRLDIIHNLKLDRTYTSLQTLGSETVVDVELERDMTEVKKKTSKVAVTAGETNITNSTVVVKQEPQDYNDYNDMNLSNSNAGQVKSEFDPGGVTLGAGSANGGDLTMIKQEPVDHDYGTYAQRKPIATCHSIKQEQVTPPKFVIPCGSNNLRLVFSGVGSQGTLSQVVQNMPIIGGSPVKMTTSVRQKSPKSSKKAQPLLQLGNPLTLPVQGAGPLPNTGVLIPNQQTGQQNLVPLLLSSSPTKVSGSQSVLQPGSILFAPALPTSTPGSGNQSKTQTRSLSSFIPVNQTGPHGSQPNSPGLVFLKCLDNQGKTYLIPQQISPNAQTSKDNAIAGKVNAMTGKTVILNNNTPTQIVNSSKLPVSLSNSKMKIPVSSTVNISQLTAVGLQPKQTPVQLAGPLIFLKPEELPKLQTKSSPPNMPVIAKSLQSNQTLRLVTPPKGQIINSTNMLDGKATVNQSSIRGQLKVTSQGLITVQKNDSSFNKDIVIKNEPGTVSVSSATNTAVINQFASSVAKQPVIILPQNNKVPVTLQNKPGPLLQTAGKVSSVNTLSNFIIVSSGKDASGQRFAVNSLTNTTASCEVKSSPGLESSNLKPGTQQKPNMLLLQTKTSGSDKPNHLVIVPVSCASNTVTRSTVSIPTVSNSSKTLIVSKSIQTIATTAVNDSVISNSVAGLTKDNTTVDKNKTMYIVLEGNANKEKPSEVIEGQRSMTSLLNKVNISVNSAVTTSPRTINGKSTNLKLIPAQSLLSSSVLSSSSSSMSSSLSSSSSSSSSSSLLSNSLLSSSSSSSSMQSILSLPNTIPVTISTSGQKETKVLVVNSNSHVTEPEKPWRSGEKKIICLKKNTGKLRKELEQTVITPLGLEDDYPDLLSLIRAAVVRHPVVKDNTAKFLHPYCAASTESWLNWNVGKRRSSEWQRASAVRKFLLSYLCGCESYKGEQLWTVKQILTWCRLHAYSPHHLEKPLHPTGLNLQSQSSLSTDKNNKFTSISGYSDVIQEVTSLQQTSGYHDNSSDDEVDIISTDVSKVKVKQEVKVMGEIPFIEYLPMSEKARFVQDIAKKLGIRFSPSEVEPGYYGHLSLDYIFAAMESFVGDILRETFAQQVNMGRYPDALGVADVYRALSNQPITDFVTNKYFGVEDTGGVPTAYR